MKKIIRIFLLVIGVFAIGGCNDKEVVTDVSLLTYLDSSNNENISYNLGLVANELKSASFTGSLKIKDKTYNFSGEVIINDSIKDSLLHINYKNNNLYLKNGNVYLSYYYNNTNVIVKDSLDAFSKEIISLLKTKGIQCNEEKINNILNNMSLIDINFDEVSKKIEKVESGFVIKYKDSSTYLNDKYLPITFDFIKNDVSLNINFVYNSVKIKMPIGYDLLTSDIEDIKQLLRVDNISELIK